MKSAASNTSNEWSGIARPSACPDRFTRGLIALSALALVAGQSAGQVWDLADDWSDAINPNGVWSYNGAPDVPISTSQPDWDPNGDQAFGSPQPAWAAAIFPLNDHVPMWFKRVSDTSSIDVPLGQVGMHGTEADDPPQWVGVSWTSPLETYVDVTGFIWYAHPGVTRNADWRIRVNDVVLTTGNVAWNDGSWPDEPLSLLEGSGGDCPLQHIAVLPGDMITLEFISLTSYACLIGVDLTVTETDPPEPCPGDLNQDCERDQADLGVLLAAYGVDDGGDIDGDGDTDQSDLGLLLSFYGVPCP